jgi:hypothetical protein
VVDSSNKERIEKFNSRIRELYSLFKSTKLPLALNLGKDAHKSINSFEMQYIDLLNFQKSFANAQAILQNKELVKSLEYQVSIMESLQERLDLPLENINFVAFKTQQIASQDNLQEGQKNKVLLCLDANLTLIFQELSKEMASLETQTNTVNDKIKIVQKFYTSIDKLKQVHPHTKPRRLPATIQE